jgi:hypothetical protein
VIQNRTLTQTDKPVATEPKPQALPPINIATELTNSQKVLLEVSEQRKKLQLEAKKTSPNSATAPIPKQPTANPTAAPDVPKINLVNEVIIIILTKRYISNKSSKSRSGSRSKRSHPGSIGFYLYIFRKNIFYKKLVITIKTAIQKQQLHLFSWKIL